MTDVVLVHWPEQRDEIPRLAEQRVPRLLLVAPAADPPEAGDVLQDWVRLPGDERDVRARLSGLRQRADQETMPVIDNHGRLVHRRLWVQLSPIHERLARLLVSAAEGVVAEQDLLTEGWPGGHPSSNALRVHLHRLRRYIRPLGLEIRGVRGEGWVMQCCWPAVVPDDSTAGTDSTDDTTAGTDSTDDSTDDTTAGTDSTAGTAE